MKDRSGPVNFGHDPFYKSVQNRGLAEIKIFAFDGCSGDFVEKSPLATGRAKHDNDSILFIINFTRSDLENYPSRP